MSPMPSRPLPPRSTAPTASTLRQAAKRQLAELRENGFGNLPVCVAKTQYSF